MRKAPALHGRDHLRGGSDPIPISLGGDACYPGTITTAVSDGTTAYNEYLRFTIPGGDIELGDYIEVTLPCTILNTSGDYAWLVQQIDCGATSIEPYPSLNFTKWKDSLSGKFLYRLLFMAVFVDPDTHIWMSDLRCATGPYSMGFGSDALTPGIDFNALELGVQDFASDIDVVFSARWTEDPGLGAAPSGITLAPLTARVKKFGCA